MTGKQDLYEAIDFGAAIVNLLGEMIEDGKITYGDFVMNLGKLVALPGLAQKAFENAESIKWSQIATPEDRTEVLTHFKQALNLPESASLTEEKIERGAKAVLDLIEFIMLVGRKPA